MPYYYKIVPNQEIWVSNHFADQSNPNPVPGSLSNHLQPFIAKLKVHWIHSLSHHRLLRLLFPASRMLCPQIPHFILPKGHLFKPSYETKQILSLSISVGFIFLYSPYHYLMVSPVAVCFCVY